MSIKGKKVTKVIKANNPAPASTTTLQDDPIVKLVNTMQSVDTKDKEAKKNEASQDDNNNSGYFYNQFESPKKDQKQEANS